MRVKLEGIIKGLRQVETVKGILPIDELSSQCKCNLARRI